MIKHIVMWKLKEDNKKENAEEIKQMLENLVGKIDGLISANVGIDIGIDDGAYDVVLVSEFKDEQSLAEYQTHKLHKQAGEFIKSVRVSRVAIDYKIN